MSAEIQFKTVNIFIKFLYFFALFFIVSCQNISSEDAQKLKNLLAKFPGSCPNPDQFDCGNGVCIALSRFRDCTQDCSDGSDEECWPGMVRCDGCRCVNPKDVDRICLDKQVNKICSIPTAVKCKSNNNCVLRSWLLDGRNDCGDWSDEDSCYQGKNLCPQNTSCRFDVSSRQVQCECNDTSLVYNGTRCNPKPNTTQPITTAAATVPVTTITTTPKSGITQPPLISTTISTSPNVAKRCNYSNIQSSSSVSVMQISMALVFNTRPTMINDLNNIKSGIPSTWISDAIDEIGRINSFIILPFSANVGDYVGTADPQTFYQTIQSLNVNSSQCRTSTFAAIQKASTVVLSNSIINVFTDSDAKDSNLLDDIIKIVNKKQIRVNFIITGNCNESMNASWSDYKKLSDYTGGEIFQISKDISDYMPVLKYTGKQMKQNFVGLDSRQFNRTGSMVVSLDSTLDEIFLTVTGADTSVQLTTINNIKQNVSSSNTKIYGISLPLPEEVTVKITGSSLVDVKWNAIGMVNYKFIFSPDTLSVNSTFLMQPIYGPATYMLVGKDSTRNFTVERAVVQTTILNEILLNSTVVVYNKKSGYQFMTAMFYPECKPFFIKISGLNVCNERYQRISTNVFAVEEITLTNNFPGNCGPNFFDCGNSYCIDVKMFRDGRIDCTTGIDEAVPMDELHCSTNRSPIPGGSPSWCGKAGVLVCKNGLCVPIQWINDGIDDCGDNTDENQPRSNSSLSTIGPTMSTTTAVPAFYNSTLEPPPSTIDDNFLYQRIYNNTCGAPGMYFQCTDGSCITVTKFRDCTFNCKDGSDEVCSSNYKKCAGCKCTLPSDNTTNCTDQQVKTFCSQPTMYNCKLSGYCVRVVDLLNDVTNCPDNSDEDRTHLDECFLGLAKCDTNAVCTKTDPNGISRCLCKFGFNGNGTSCVKPHSK